MRELMLATAEHFNLRTHDEGEYSIEIDPRGVNELTIALLRKLGFNRISLGVQDFEPRVQKAINRIQSEEQTSLIMQAARRHQFKSINIDLIYGLPFQTVASFARTLTKAIAADPDRLSVFNYAHLPQLFKTQQQINMADLPSPTEKLDIFQHTITRLTEAGYVYIGMDHFAKPDDDLATAQRDGTLHRNFQGYSTHADCDLVGLGITAISQVADCYAQNVRTLEDYYKHIDAGRLPVHRGIELSPDDLLRREVIMQLICHLELDIGTVERRHGISFRTYFDQEQAELQTRQDDGLLVQDGNTIRVSPRGKLLIRNICMVFDQHLREKAPGQPSSPVI